MKTPQELLQQALEVGECLLPDAPPGGRSAARSIANDVDHCLSKAFCKTKSARVKSSFFNT